MTLPLAHLGHYLWIFYLLPVMIVIAGIVKTTLSEKNRDSDDPAPARSVPRGRRSSGGWHGGGSGTDQPDRPQDPPRDRTRRPELLRPYRISARRRSSAAEISSRTGPSASRSTSDSRKPSMISVLAAAGSSPREVR